MFKNPFKKPLKKAELKEIDIDLISLCIGDVKPANGKGVIAKHDGKNYLIRGATVKCAAGDEGRVYVTVYEPDVKDSQGDTATAEELRKACEKFNRKGFTGKIDINHNQQVIRDGDIVESYILKSADEKHFPNTKVGAWVMVLKFDTEGDSWKIIKGNKLNGVSMFGECKLPENELFEKMEEVLTKTIEKLEKQNKDENKPAIEELKKQLDEVRQSAKSGASNQQFQELQKSLDQFIGMISKAFNTQIQGENINEPTEEKVKVFDTTVIVKSDRKELYRSFASVNSGKEMNVLSDNLGEQFIDTVFDFSPSDVFTDITVVKLDKSEKIDKGLINDIVFRNKLDDKVVQSVGEFELECPTSILLTKFKLQQETVEFYRDSIGDTKFGAFVEQTLTNKINKEMKVLLFRGDRASAIDRFKPIDGLLKKIKASGDTHEIKMNASKSYAEAILASLEHFTPDMLSHQDEYKMYCSPHTYLKMQREMTKRNTPLGDLFVKENAKLLFSGIPVSRRHMPDDVIVLGLSKFLILGYRTDVTIKLEHSGDDWEWIWNVRVRFGTLHVPGGMVKSFELVA